MAYCTNCGSFVKDGAKFCGVCGSKMESEPQPYSTSKVTKNDGQRRVKYDGEVHKCPHCGATLSSFTKICPECGHELRGVDSAESVSEFFQRYSSAASNGKKVDIIRTFAIPNTKEDILEFAILASSNIDEGSYTREQTIVSGGVSQQEVSDAWMAKFEQVYQKASITLEGTSELKRIEKLYNEKTDSLNKSKKAGERKSNWNKRKRWIGILAAVLGFVLFEFLCFLPGLSSKWKFEKQLAEVQECIEMGNYEKSLTLAYSMDTSYSHDHEKIQSDLISRIQELQGESQGLARIPTEDFNDEQYSQVVDSFEKAGFVNIKTEKLNDLIVGIFHSEGEVEEVEIDGKTDYEKGSYVSPDVSVIIRYHSSTD